jgi:hypothetical protein
MASVNQQPISRVVGRPDAPDIRPLTREEREMMDRHRPKETRAPKGVFIYRSHQEMDADRQQWLLDLMTALAVTR